MEANISQADPDVDAGMTSRNTRSRHPRGGAGAATARGGASSYSQGNGEDAPLLAGHGGADVGKGVSTGSDDEGDDGDKGYEWPGQAEFDGLPWWKRPSVLWMLPPFLLTTLAFGGIIVPKLNLILDLVCNEYLHEQQLAHPNHHLLPVVFGAENPQCQIPEVQSRVAIFTLVANLIAGLLSAFSSPKLGALSDRYGRKRIIALCSAGSLVSEVITILAATRPESFNVYWIIVGYAFEGLTGSFIASMALANAYAADCTPPHRRNVAFGYFHGCLFTGIGLGPIVAGVIIKKAGTILVAFYIALGCHLLFIIFLLLVIPESLSRSRQLAAREKHRIHVEEESNAPGYSQWRSWLSHLNPWTLLKPLSVLYPTGPGSSAAVRRNLLLLAAVDTTMFGIAMGSMTVVLYYSKFSFDWDTYEQSKFLSIVNSSRVFCLLVVLPSVTRLVRGSDKAGKRQRNTGCDGLDLALIRLAVFFDTLGYLGYALSHNGSMFILSGVIASIGGMGSPTLQSSLTKHVPPDRTGQLLGASGLLHALARIAGPTVTNAIWAATVYNFTQTVFVCLTATFLVAGVCAWMVRPHVYLNDPDAPASNSTVRAVDEE